MIARSIPLAVAGVVMQGAPKSGALCTNCWTEAKRQDVHGLLTYFMIKRGRRLCTDS